MKYLMIMLLAISCSEQNKLNELDVAIQGLNQSTERLKFHTYALTCLNEMDIDKLKADKQRLNLPSNEEVGSLLVDSYLFHCVKNKYNSEK